MARGRRILKKVHGHRSQSSALAFRTRTHAHFNANDCVYRFTTRHIQTKRKRKPVLVSGKRHNAGIRCCSFVQHICLSLYISGCMYVCVCEVKMRGYALPSAHDECANSLGTSLKRSDSRTHVHIHTTSRAWRCTWRRRSAMPRLQK